MTLDAPKSDAELLAMLAQKQGQSRSATFGVQSLPVGNVTMTGADSSLTVNLVFGGSTILLPVRLRIPWSALISDNVKHLTDTKTGRRYCTTEYRDARKRVRALASDAMHGRPPAECPLALVGRIWLPNNRRHDVHNYGKCLADALTGVVFADDSWLYDTRWIRAGVDVDAPRCELTITPLTP